LVNCNGQKTDSYLDYYDSRIRPVINRLDIAIKCKDRLKDSDIAGILGMETSEILKIKAEHKLKKNDKTAIITYLKEGSSEICGIFKRETEFRSPYVYSFEEISYIYNIELKMLQRVCERKGIHRITKENINEVFKNIPFPA
jgi:hypothetical protein